MVAAAIGVGSLRAGGALSAAPERRGRFALVGPVTAARRSGAAPAASGVDAGSRGVRRIFKQPAASSRRARWERR